MNVPMNKITANNDETINNNVINCSVPIRESVLSFLFGKLRNFTFLFENCHPQNHRCSRSRLMFARHSGGARAAQMCANILANLTALPRSPSAYLANKPEVIYRFSPTPARASSSGRGGSGWHLGRLFRGRCSRNLDDIFLPRVYVYTAVCRKRWRAIHPV